jgi:hypothetical protein
MRRIPRAAERLPHGPGGPTPAGIADPYGARAVIGIRPCSTEAATRPNKEHRDVREFPFSYLALAICAENGRNEGIVNLMGISAKSADEVGR